ncbi:GNAT family N-acetyltransferase [Deinococcus lacus]|uniref:GNAT family N-acetyltransferase n=1 Tax=Deinococcus lacus TaxID=392561 RepID=A0ABW1Y8V8_9DEIO
MTPRIRPATAADLPTILDIYNHAVLHSAATYDHAPVSLESRAAWLAERQAASFPVLVLEGAAGQVLGWGSYGPFRPKLGYSRTVEHSLYLAPDAQGQGLGSLLLTALIEQAQAQGMHSMIGVIDAQNAASLRFHIRHGFDEVGHLPEIGHKFGQWVGATLVLRRLTETPAPPHREA